MQESGQDDMLSEDQKRFRCRICGHIFTGNEPPQDFRCPRCGSGSEQFIELRQRWARGDCILTKDVAPPYSVPVQVPQELLTEYKKNG